MNHRSGATRAYRRALAGLAALGISATGAFVVVSPALAQEETAAQCMNYEPKKFVSAGSFSLDEVKNYKSGELITINGTGLTPRGANGFLAVKFNDGNIAFPADYDKAGTTLDRVESGEAYTPNGAVKDDGTVSITLRVPQVDLDGAYNIRVLAGADEEADGGSWSVPFFINNSGVNDGHCGTIADSTDPSETPSTTSAAPSTTSAAPSTTSATPTTTEEPAPVEFFGEEKFNSEHIEVANGQYQSVFDAANDTLYSTYAVGRPPISVSGLQKIDTNTLTAAEPVAAPQADAADPEAGLLASYGIAVNPTKNELWVTNTRQNTVSVYNADTLEPVKVFDTGSVAHGRDVAIDVQNQKVYVTSASRSSEAGLIHVYNAETYAEEETIDLNQGDNKLSTTMSLAFDQNTGELFTVGLGTNNAVKVDTRNGNKVTYYNTFADKAETVSGVAWDPKQRNLWVISQGTGNAVALDIDNDGKVIADVATGNGALNGVYEPSTGYIYVVNRTDGSVTVIDGTSFEKLANLPAGKNPNHLSVDDAGNVYLVNKAGNTREDGTKFDDLYRYSAKVTEPGGSSEPSESSEISNSVGGFLSNLFNSVGKFFGGILSFFAQLINVLLGGLGRLSS